MFNSQEGKVNNLSNLSDAQLLLLSNFKYTRSLSSFKDDDDYWNLEWNNVLKEKATSLIKKFIENGYIIVNPCKYKVSDLKKILEERGLEQTGMKKDLIDRLLKDDVNNLDSYRCSEKGINLVNDYLAKRNKIRYAAEQKVIEYLKEKDLANAVKTMVDFESKQVFPRIMGIDCNDYDITEDIKHLNDIFYKKPSILKNCEDDVYEDIILCTTLSHLWGLGWLKYFWDVLPIERREKYYYDSETYEFKKLKNTRFDFNAACRMLSNYSYYLRDKRQYSTCGLDKVQIYDVSDDDLSCPKCRKKHNKVYKITDILEIPFENCTSEAGCRCHWLPWF